MDRRIDHPVEQGLARRLGQRVVLARDLLGTLRRRELNEAAANCQPTRDSPIGHQPKASTSLASIERRHARFRPICHDR
jgi:hypothetical protein